MKKNSVFIFIFVKSMDAMDISMNISVLLKFHGESLQYLHSAKSTFLPMSDLRVARNDGGDST